MAVSYKRGFTLIELLVVIAIIGLLAAVVLASVGGARNKGVDASVKGQMSNMRSAAELFASNNSNSYLGACVGSLSAMTTAAASSTGALVQTNLGGAYNRVTCNDSAGAWLAESPLSGSALGAAKMWCVDSTGASKGETTNVANGTTYVCQ